MGLAAICLSTGGLSPGASDLPRPMGVEWFRKAKFGLFLHYGVYSLLGRGEWVQCKEKIPVKEYEKLKERFTAEKFDADFITDLAMAAGMKYVTLTAMHHDGFCLFQTRQTDFNSVNSPAKRDLVGELAGQCHKKGLGICLYYSHGRNWRHPHAMMNRDYGKSARPDYSPQDPTYATGKDHDISKYVAYCQAQVKELLTNYGAVANIWFDGIGTTMSGPWEKELHVPELYRMIKNLQPECLISYKWGLTGTEDFAAPEYDWLRQSGKLKAAQQSGKPIELCRGLAGWGYEKAKDGKHAGIERVMESLHRAQSLHANLLLNLGPRPDGSIDPQDVETLHATGRK